MTQPLLHVEGLQKRFGGRQVVSGVYLDVRGGEVVGLLGKNGAGKTTSFRMIIGLIQPDAGKVEFCPSDESHAPPIDLSTLPMFKRARAGVGYLSQAPSVFRQLSVRDNILAVLEFQSGLRRAARIEKTQRLIQEFGLSKVQHSLAQTLSGGERRRLEIARALALEPKLIMLDEPFSGVDPIAVAEIRSIIEGLTTRGIGILLTDHNVYDTLKISDRAYIIDNGRIMTQGTPQEIGADPKARKYYLGEDFDSGILDGDSRRLRTVDSGDGEEPPDGSERLPVVITD